MLEHWIWLATRKGVNEHTALMLLDAFADIDSLYYAAEDDYKLVEGLQKKELESLRDKSLTEASKILNVCRNKGIHILTYRDAAYPSRLKHIANPPLVLYYKGCLPSFDAEAAVAVVGTRKASAYGCMTSKSMGYQIAKCGGLVISGLAGGIDSMAMRGALMAGGTVVGVLGCGVDVVYPSSNRELYKDVEQRGCLLSEFPPGSEPLGWHFPKRNRVMSGLSCGVLVVEAPVKSGALITAQHALDQGRDVFAVPGNIDTPNSQGTNHLLRSGAIVAQYGWDVMQEYEAMFPGKVRRWAGAIDLDTSPQELRRTIRELQVSEPVFVPSMKEQKKSVDKPIKTPYIEDNNKSELSPDEQAVMKLLDQELKHVDLIIGDSGLSAAQVLASLTLLEVKGLVVRHPGKYYSLPLQ